MRERFAFTLSNLSDAQREIVTTAIDKQHYVVGPNESLPAAFISLLDRFRNQEQAHGLDEDGDGELNGSYLVRYENEGYWTRLFVQRDMVQTDLPR